MRRNNFIDYEKHLSHLGKRVFKVLVNQYDSERQRSRNLPHQRRYDLSQNRILTFREQSVPEHPVPDYQQILLDNNNNDDDDRPFEFNFTESNHHHLLFPRVITPTPVFNPVPPPAPTTLYVPTSVKLVKTIDSKKSNVTHNCSKDNPINSALGSLDNHKPRNLIQDFLLNKNSNGVDEGALLSSPVIEDAFNADKNGTRDINWNDMFDTELFSDLDTPAVAVLENIRKEMENDNIHQTHFPYDLETNSKKAQNDLKDEVCKKPTKRKSQSKITDSVPKKVKNTAMKTTNVECSNSLFRNNCFRKQKYTKTVKNWLNDSHAINETVKNSSITKKYGTETIITNKSYETPEKVNKPKLKKKVIQSEETPEKFGKQKLKKKIIQTQLTNKGGVMKFGQPNMTTNDKNSKSDESVAGLKVAGNIVEKDSVMKDRKSELKFVAPIKSQILLKNLTYEVTAVTKTNIEKYRRHVCKEDGSEVVIVLIYSNGFCQLNDHHTDDTCVPEGIMIKINDCFYYMKDIDEVFREILDQTLKNHYIICYEGKKLLIYLSQINLEINDTTNIFDAKIGGSLVDADNAPENFSALQKLLSFVPKYTIATECVHQKSAWYINLLQECALRLKSLLMEEDLWKLFVEIEMPLLPIIADMERRGVCVDVEKLKSMETILLTKLNEIEQQCYKAAGKAFQINSTQQVRNILYDELQLDTKSNIKIRETISTGAKSTSESMLRSLAPAHPLPNLILQYRHLHKAHATFVTGIAQHVKDGVVKPTWLQTAAATGRIASNNPNLQAIPKAPFSLNMCLEATDDDGGERGGEEWLCFRSVYVSRAGHVLLAADFKQVECRVFAHAAADEDLLRTLAQGDDLFIALAAKWLNKPAGEVCEADRERTKRIVYASLYGAGARKLMDILHVGYDQALTVLASFNRTFPSLKRFCREVVARCAGRGGRLATPRGRARRFPHIGSVDAAQRAHAERQAVNFIVQGCAADVCKAAMVCTWRRLRGAGAARLVLQIHDELVWEVPEDQLYQVAALIKEEMEGCGRQGGVWPLPVALYSGRTWGALTPLALPPPPPPATNH